MSKKVKAPIKSMAQWEKMYNTYLMQQEKFSEELNGNVDTLSFAEFRDNYSNLWIGGIRKNITRLLVQNSAIISYKQARVYAQIVKNMQKEIFENRGNETPEEFAIWATFDFGGKIKIKDIRRNPAIANAIDAYYKLIKARRKEEQGDQFEDFGYEEWIDGSP